MLRQHVISGTETNKSSLNGQPLADGHALLTEHFSVKERLSLKSIGLLARLSLPRQMPRWTVRPFRPLRTRLPARSAQSAQSRSRTLVWRPTGALHMEHFDQPPNMSHQPWPKNVVRPHDQLVVSLDL